MREPELRPADFEPAPARLSQSKAGTRVSLGFWSGIWRRFRRKRLALSGLVVMTFLLFMTVAGPMFYEPEYYRVQDYTAIDQPPSREHLFGTDGLGRDIFVRTWTGARISLFIAVAAALLDISIGVLYGAISGYFGGLVDEVMMRIVDILYGIPYMLLAVLMVVIFQPGVFSIILAMAVTGWIGMARLIRGQVLQLKEREFVLAGRMMGGSAWQILCNHLVPNMLGIILVQLTLTIPTAIFGEAFLSFIGLGVRPPMASWGVMVEESFRVLQVRPWQLLFPAAGITLTMFAFNVIGDGLRDALDPRIK